MSDLVLPEPQSNTQRPDAWTIWKIGKRYDVAPPGETRPGELVHQVATRDDAERLRAGYTGDRRIPPDEAILERRPAPLPKARGRGTASHYPCGHPRTRANSRRLGGKFKFIECRQCDRERMARWLKDHPRRADSSRRRWVENNPRYRHRSHMENRLAHLLYNHLRALAIRDGRWPVTARAPRELAA